MSLLRDVEWEPCLLERRPDPELTNRLRERHRRVSSSVHYFSPCPDLCESVADLNALVTTRVSVDAPLLEKIGVVVSQDNSCRYCYAVQRVVLIATGVSESRLRELTQEVLAGDLSTAERAALEFARRVSRSNPLPTRAEARRLEDVGFSDFQVREIAGAIALMVFFNRVSTVPALPPEPMEQLPETWRMRLLRPLFGLYVRWLERRVSAEVVDEDRLRGPFEPVLLAINGLPLAPALRAFLDKLLVDGALPARAKALIFAVVGRALGCPHSIEEGSRLAIEQGVAPSTVEEALDHLSSPALDETENVALALARETVWYQPGPIQRRARQLRESLTVEQLIECILAAAAANMVCRLGSVVVDRR